jgi:predicted CXXCH cytochrome family protein
MHPPRPVRRLALAIALALAPSAASPAQPPAPAAPAKGGAPAKGAAPAKAAPAAKAASPVAPLKASEITNVHAAYETGDCALCHVRNDPKDPGKLSAPVNELCFGCHDELRDLMKLEVVHWPAQDACTNCHNPHGGKQRKLLIDETVALCTSCHGDVGEYIAAAKVKHNAVTTDAKCANCHNPHGSRVEKLLVTLPFDLCLRCHSKEGMRSADGRSMVNMKAWLQQNPDWHAPVKAKDCSACHRPHGSPNFRLLVASYPEKFYAPYETENYKLCFGCHNERVFREQETTTLTGFRNGSKNLHFVHVNKLDRGRTCRACHEVHASQQSHHIREGVPYGVKGWILKLNYAKTPNGGSCAKTCHETRSYDNKKVVANPSK